MTNLQKSELRVPSVAAVVVLYNSEDQVLANIDSYASQVTKVFVIDNSENQRTKLISSLAEKPTITYHWMQGNKGIAAALNKGAALAIGAGCDYLLMMDDDSRLIEGTVDSMCRFLAQQADSTMIGLISAQPDPNVRNQSARSVWYCITSGSMLSLKAFQQCGPFMEELFIDAVDHEYCFRLKQANYTLIILGFIAMPHRMGLPEEVKLFGKVMYRWSSHSPVRNYYLVRNFLWVLKRYKRLLPSKVKWEIYYGVLKACALDVLLGNQKFSRLQYISRAVADFGANRLGKF